MTTRPLATLALATTALVWAWAALPARAQEAARDLLICYPNAPGSARSAEPIMARLRQHLSDASGSPLRATYFNEQAPAEEWLRDHRPSAGILSLSLYLAWQRERALVPLAHAERNGASEERYHLLVRHADPRQALADLAQAPSDPARGPRVWSAHLDDPRFATNVVFQGALAVRDLRQGERITPGFQSGTIRVVSSTRTLSVLRRLQRGEDYLGEPVDAVLVDDTVWTGLQELERFRGAFRVLYTTPPLPTPPVVRFGAEDEEYAGRVAAALRALGQSEAGRALQKSLLVTAFTEPQRERLAALVERYHAEVP